MYWSGTIAGAAWGGPTEAVGDGVQQVHSLVTGVCAVLALLCLPAANPFLGAAGFLLVPILWRLLWRPGEPAVLLFAALFQWLQAYTAVLSANFSGETLEAQFGGPELASAACWSLLSVLALALGMRCMLRGVDNSVVRSQFAFQSRSLCPHKLFIAYVLASVASAGLLWISLRAGGLRQPILAFTLVKWVPIFLLAWTTIQHKKPPMPLVIVVVCEILLGMTGYFSAFKDVFFLLIVVIVGVMAGAHKLRIVPLLATVVPCLILCGFWQAVKADYRLFLNQGTNQQVVRVPLLERFHFLASAAANLDHSALASGADSGIDRLEYISFFAHCIRHVPASVPHQEGELWMDAVAHPLMPRAIFPDKKEIHASDRTRQFTGIQVAGHEQGAAISIGYPAESYIDFGIPWMLAPPFLLGALFAAAYRSLLSMPYVLGGGAVATALLLQHSKHLEASNIIIVGGLLTGWLAAFLIGKGLLPRLWQLLQADDDATLYPGSWSIR